MSFEGLRLISVLYLMLPNVLFFLSWTNLVICIICLVLLLILSILEFQSESFGASSLLNAGDLILISFAAAFLTIISGVTGICYQTIDHWVHNTKYFELTTNKWPIRFPENGPSVSYYLGYYVVPALLSKLVGETNEVILFLWTWFGILLGLAWAYLILNKKILFVFIALTFGDFSHVIDKLLRRLSIETYSYSEFGMENWSNVENLFWAPNQFIPSAIIGGMFAMVIIKKIDWATLIFPVALTFWWAIFPAFVCGLLLVCLFLKEIFDSKFLIDWKRLLLKMILPTVICLPVLIFFLSHEETPISGFIWEYRIDLWNTAIEYLVNIGLNVAAFYFLFHVLWRKGLVDSGSFAFFVILVMMLFFPVYRIGKMNDFLLRGMMPILMVVGLYLLAPISRISFNKFQNMVSSSFTYCSVFFFLLSSTFLAGSRIFRGITNNIVWSERELGIFHMPIPYDNYSNVYEVLRVVWSQEEANQYLGKSDSIYEKYIAPAIVE